MKRVGLVCVPNTPPTCRFLRQVIQQLNYKHLFLSWPTYSGTMRVVERRRPPCTICCVTSYDCGLSPLGAATHRGSGSWQLLAYTDRPGNIYFQTGSRGRDSQYQFSPSLLEESKINLGRLPCTSMTAFPNLPLWPGLAMLTTFWSMK